MGGAQIRPVGHPTVKLRMWMIHETEDYLTSRLRGRDINWFPDRSSRTAGVGQGVRPWEFGWLRRRVCRLLAQV
jgi:hypothetical protein